MEFGTIAILLGSIASLRAHPLDIPKTPQNASIQEAVPMPNIGYLFRGYDVMKGNPLQVSGLPVDPGFREPIFKASYESGSVTADQRYLQPDGTDIIDCSGSCTLSFGSLEMSGKKSYTDSIERKVSVEFGFEGVIFGAKFSASDDYKRVEESTSSYSNIFTHADATCCSYLAQTLTFAPPPLSADFHAAVGTLTEEYNEAVYQRIIHYFGTHFVTEAQMGALFGQQSEISEEAWTTMLEEDFDISVGASLSAFGITASSDFMNSEQKEMAEEFASKATEQKTYTIGSLPPADNNINTWVQGTKTSPAPMSLRLTSILDLLDGLHGVEVSNAVKANLKRALDDYCGILEEFGEVTTCNAPGPDPPFPNPPKKRTWHKWSSRHMEGWSNPVKECNEGEYVEQMIWSEQNGFGLVNLAFRCSDGMQYETNPNNHNGYNNRAMTCEGFPGGFRKMTGMENSDATKFYGIVNVRSFCLNEETQQTSNDNPSGSWNPDRMCDDKQQIVGFETRVVGGAGIINFRFECA